MSWLYFSVQNDKERYMPPLRFGGFVGLSGSPVTRIALRTSAMGFRKSTTNMLVFEKRRGVSVCLTGIVHYLHSRWGGSEQFVGKVLGEMDVRQFDQV